MQLGCEVIVDIGVIVDHSCLNVLFINLLPLSLINNQHNSKYLLDFNVCFVLYSVNPYTVHICVSSNQRLFVTACVQRKTHKHTQKQKTNTNGIGCGFFVSSEFRQDERRLFVVLILVEMMTRYSLNFLFIANTNKKKLFRNYINFLPSFFLQYQWM